MNPGNGIETYKTKRTTISIKLDGFLFMNPGNGIETF